jgi:hypothetical protein
MRSEERRLFEHKLHEGCSKSSCGPMMWLKLSVRWLTYNRNTLHLTHSFGGSDPFVVIFFLSLFLLTSNADCVIEALLGPWVIESVVSFICRLMRVAAGVPRAPPFCRRLCHVRGPRLILLRQPTTTYYTYPLRFTRSSAEMPSADSPVSTSAHSSPGTARRGSRCIECYLSDL